MWAAAAGNLDVTGTLLANGANVNHSDNNGYTTLWLSAARGHTLIVKMLLEKGADPGVKNKEGFTILMDIAMAGKTEIVQILLDNGAKVDAKDKHGRTRPGAPSQRPSAPGVAARRSSCRWRSPVPAWCHATAR